MNLKMIFIFIFIILFAKGTETKAPIYSSDKQEDCIIPAKLVFSLGSSEESKQMFFKPRDVAISKNGNIYVLDSGECKIKCFSFRGDFLFSFGGEGQGPGEFSKYASTLKILSDNNLYLIDNHERRISCFSLDGKFKKSFRISYRYSDIFLFKDSYFLTNFELERGHKPIHITTDFRRVEKNFGEIIDPGDFFKMKEFSVIKSSLSLEKNSSIIVNSKGEIFYSQWNPYKIIKYSSEGRKIKEFYRKTPFETKMKICIQNEDEKVSILEEPSSFIPEIYLIKKDLILVPIFSPDLKENYIDIYDREGNLLYACKLPIQLYGESTIIVATEYDGKNFYILYFSPDKPPTLSKFEIQLPF